MRVALVVGAWLVLLSRDAAACSYAGNAEHTLDPSEQAVDTAPPAAVGEPTYSVRRGRGPERSGCSESGSSCDDIGGISVHLGEVSDDRTLPGEMGFWIELVSGSPPSGINLPSTLVRADSSRSLHFNWSDGADDDQEAIDFTLRIRAVDRAGNEGPPSELRIRDDGSSEGCALAASSGLDLIWILLALALLRSRAQHGVEVHSQTPLQVQKVPPHEGP